MLFKQILYYFLARGVPGIINFAAVAVYTRVLAVEEFGIYSIAITIATLVYVTLFQYLALVIGRFYPASIISTDVLLKDIKTIFIVTSLVVLVASFFAAGLMKFFGGKYFWLAVLLGFLIVIQAWHELNLKLATAQINPIRFGLLSGSKSIIAFIVTVSVFQFTVSENIPVLGLIVGGGAACYFFSRKVWPAIIGINFNIKNFDSYLSYGVPLAATFILLWLVSSSDKLIIGVLLDSEAVGIYSIGNDLAQNTLGLVLSILNTASLPIVMRALEMHGVYAAKERIKKTGEFIFAFAVSGALGLIMISESMFAIFVGVDFRGDSISIFVWASVIAAVIGVKSFYFDIAFHLAKRTIYLIYISAFAAVINIILNFLLIPEFGIIGACWASLSSMCFAMLLSAVLGRRVFDMPNISPMLVKSVAIAFLVYLACKIVMIFIQNDILKILFSMGLSGVIFCVAIFLFKLGGGTKVDY